MLSPQEHLVWLVNHCSQQRTSYTFPCALSLVVLARFVSGTMVWSALRHFEEAKLTISLAAGHKSLEMLHPHGVWCPDDCGKTIGTGFLPLCPSGDNWHCWFSSLRAGPLFQDVIENWKIQAHGRAKAKQCFYSAYFILTSVVWAVCTFEEASLLKEMHPLHVGSSLLDACISLGPHLEQVAKREAHESWWAHTGASPAGKASQFPVLWSGAVKYSLSR